MNDIKIYICTHKDFDKPVTNPCYQIIDSRIIQPNLPLKDDFWSEFYQFKWLSEQTDLPEYVGFCHYRRYFSFLDNIPSMTPKKVITTTPMLLYGTVEQHYATFHNIDDLNIIGDIINTMYPEYKDTFQHFIKGKVFYPCNMFIMHRDKFKEYANFVFSIMLEYLNRVGTDIYKHIQDNQSKYIKNFPPNNTKEYQYRIGGFAGERLTNVFIMQNFGLKETYNMIITEEKYKNN